MLYELRNLQKDYGRRTVLDLEELFLEKGKILGLLGPNGAGKTTLLEILGFIKTPTSGEIWFNDKQVDYNANALINIRRKVVLVYQLPILFTTTVYKNLEFPLGIRKTPKVTREKTIDELLDLVGMREFKHAMAHRLSGGETQRIAIARALACFPEVILLDEPTANVDVENQIAIERIIQDINQKGISVIITTHDMIQASRLAKATLFLFEGKLARSIYENIFSGRIEETENGRKYCVIQNRLKFAVQTVKVGTVRITIDPKAVELGPDLDYSEKDNAFKGKLMQLTDEDQRVRALVDVGIPISVLIPKESFRTMSIAMGEAVWLKCPAKSIEII
jgi:tungstate transport system ATP-binding protein